MKKDVDARDKRGHDDKFQFRHSGMRLLAQARNPYSRRWLWIPGSLASLAPRNDGFNKETQMTLSYPIASNAAHPAYAKTYYFGSLLTEKYPHLQKQLSAAG